MPWHSISYGDNNGYLAKQNLVSKTTLYIILYRLSKTSSIPMFMLLKQKVLLSVLYGYVCNMLKMLIIYLDSAV